VLILTLHSKSSHFPPSVSAFNLKMLWDDCDVITVHEQDEYTHACELFDKPITFNSDYRRYIEIYRSCSTYVGGRMHGAIPCLASGAMVHLVCHEPKHRECEWVKSRLACPEALMLWEQSTLLPDELRKHAGRFDQKLAIKSDFEEHQNYLLHKIGQFSSDQPIEKLPEDNSRPKKS
jgi:hypothetical protein